MSVVGAKALVEIEEGPLESRWSILDGKDDLIRSFLYLKCMLSLHGRVVETMCCNSAVQALLHQPRN